MADIVIDLDGHFEGVIKSFTKETQHMTEAQLAENLAHVTKSAQAKLKKRSRKKTGEYAKGWRVSKPKPIEGVGASSVVYNTTKPSLTHLLEKGHAKIGGGRVAGDGIIAQVYKESAQEFSAGA